jgi:hypothetical protein
MGNKPITAGSAVKLEVSGQTVKVTGPKGTLSYTMPAGITLEQDGNTIHVKRANDERQMKMYRSTAAADEPRRTDNILNERRDSDVAHSEVPHYIKRKA